MVRVRENAESIAFLKGEATEAKAVDERFQHVVENMHDINVAERNLDFFTTLYNYTVWILPVVVVAPSYFAGNVDLGVVQQSASAFSHVLDDVSVIINQFESLSEFAAGIDRLFQFYIAVRKADNDRGEACALLSRTGSADEDKISGALNEQTITLLSKPPIGKYASLAQAASNEALSVRDLTLFTPGDKRVLFRRLSFSVPWGRRVLIAGNSGIGKSSLLRAVAGLWTAGTGTIERPSDSDVYFLPQRPYCALGSLRDQLLYPRLASDYSPSGDETKLHEEHLTIDGTTWQNVSDEELVEILKTVDLLDVAQRCGSGDAILGLNAVVDWSNTLSLGEQQRLAFGRLLVNGPAFVILDESTSALDVASENRMYSLLRDRNVTYMSVGHRLSLEAYHNYKLTLQGGDIFSLETLKE